MVVVGVVVTVVVSVSVSVSVTVFVVVKKAVPFYPSISIFRPL